MAEFEKIDPDSLSGNIFTMLDKDWMLITAGDESSFNTMTASWGGLGILWHKRVAYCFVRPTRHTYQFMEKYRYYTLSFYPSKYREALNICGTKSGRDGNKVAEAGLNAVADVSGAIYFKEANLVFVCDKLYAQNLSPDFFLSPQLDSNYPQKDYHRMFIGEIISAYINK